MPLTSLPLGELSAREPISRISYRHSGEGSFRGYEGDPQSSLSPDTLPLLLLDLGLPPASL